MTRLLWAGALALVVTFQTGCCCMHGCYQTCGGCPTECGPSYGCGLMKGCGWGHGFCGLGCGARYCGAYCDDPPRCDPCDSCGHYVGRPEDDYYAGHTVGTTVHASHKTTAPVIYEDAAPPVRTGRWTRSGGYR